MPTYPCAGGCGRQVFQQGSTCSNCQARNLVGGLRAPVVVAQPVAPQLAPGTLPGGAVLEMKCRRSGQLNWIAVANNSTIYVLKDAIVEFKADSTGGAANLRTLINYQTAQWTGTAANNASVSATRNITFGANSPNVASPSTVIVTFGGQSVTVNVITYTLNIVSTPADNFANRSQTELGVDERVSLGFTTTPVGVTALNAGGLLWKFGGGMAAGRATVGLLHNATTHIAPPINDGRADYVAPNRVHAGGQLQTSKEVTLQLSIVAGPSIGLGPELKFRIHKPAAHMTRVNGLALLHYNQLPQGAAASAGFFGQIYFAPKNVSFRTLRWREGVGNMELTGAMVGAVQGAALAHVPTAHQNAIHGTINGGNANTGCYVNQTDRVSGGTFGYAVPQFHSATTVVGVQKWPIQWEYTYADLDPLQPNGGTAWVNPADWISMQIAHHIGKLYQNGKFEIFKGHVGCAYCDPSVSCELGEGHNWP